MASFAIVARQHIEQEWLHVVVQSFVVEKQFGQQAQILAIQFVHVAIHFEHGDFVATINFCAWRMPPCAFLLMPIQNGFTLAVLQAEFAEKQLRQSENESIFGYTSGNLHEVECDDDSDWETADIYLAYSCGNGLEYHVSMSHWPNSMAAGHLSCAAIAIDDDVNKFGFSDDPPCTAKFKRPLLMTAATVSAAFS